jgi:membrane-bound lytic murein transglycosylase D
LEASGDSGEEGGTEGTSATPTSSTEKAPQLALPLPDDSEPSSHPELAAIAFPSVLTSDAPPPSTERAEGSTDLDWLQGLVPPELPIRWDDRVVKMLEQYRSSPQGRAAIRGLFRRMGRYEGMIRTRLREARLPEDLIYVAMVESGFDPLARSGAGAVGMWQLVADTAEGYGLEISRWVDTRSGPEQSTDAAVRYLADLHRQLGSWELALAAFNMGYGALLRSMVKYNTNDFWWLANLEAGLPYETVYYVARVMACAVVGHNLERFGLEDLAPEPTRPY